MKLQFLILFILPVVTLAQDEPIAPVPGRRPIRPPPNPIVDDRVIPESYFTVVAPYDIRPGHPYDIHIRGFKLVKPIKIDIRIEGTQEGGKPFKIHKTAALSHKKSKDSVTFETSKIPKGNYVLYVESGNFKEKRTLTYVTRAYSFLILINKAIFLPGDLVQYKIFSIDHQTKSINPKCLSTVSISDQNGNVVTSSQNVTFKHGRYASDFKLSNKAGLGIYTLQIQCDTENVNKQFEVAEYTLPLVDAQLQIPELTPTSYGKITVTVNVAYTFGGDASGTAKISIMNFNGDTYKKELTITTGSASFDLDIAKDLHVQSEQFGSFTATLVFEDTFTGSKVTSKKSFSVQPNIYSFIVKSDPKLKAGPYKFTVTLRKFDGSPAPAGTLVNVIPENPNTIPKQTLKLDKDGTASSSVDVPKGTPNLSMRLTAKDAYQGYVSANAHILTGEFLNIEALTDTPQINEKIWFEITSGEPVDYIIVHVVCKGVLIQSTTAWFENEDPKLTYFSFKPKLKHVPGFQVIAYYINAKGNFVTGQTYVTLSNKLNNYVKITPYESEVKPGAKVDFDVESYVHSTVSTAAIDQRVLLLKQGANFTKQNVFESLQKYNNYEVVYDWENIANYEWIFGGMGLFVFTDIPRPPRHFFPQRMDRPQAAPGEKGGAPKSSSDNVKIREDFRETFFWRDIDIKNFKYNDIDYDDEYYYHGLETVREKVPESITKYLIYGVSMSKYDGIGLTEDVTSVTTFLPFFLSVELPYSVKRNEVLKQIITVFNYLKKGQTFEIKIKKDPKYEGVDLAQYGWTDSNGFYVQKQTSKVGSHIKLEFALKPKKIGFIPFEVTATGPLAGDGIKKQLRCIPEGIPRSITTSALIALDSTTPSQIEGSLECKLPDSAYLDTTEISGTIVGDLFGKALSNLDKLIHMPGGCGEQTMLSFAPNVAIYLYLQASGKLSPKLKALIEQYTLSGYQNELKYQRTDGSFSAFGNSDPSGSTWLSAYVALFFELARPIVPIDKNVIQRAADFVAAQQDPATGKFGEPGRVIHTDMQGGSGQGGSLVAYCSILFTILLPDYPQYLSVRNKAISYLELHYNNGLQTAYEMGIIAYAFNLAGSDKATDAYHIFNDMRTETDLMISWITPPPPKPDFWYFNSPRSLDIEATSYGLLTYVQRNVGLLRNLKVVKYLISKANNFGGYSSSQDTVMAFYALSKFASSFSSKSNLYVSASTSHGDFFETTITSANSFDVQSFNLNPLTRKLDYTAKTQDSGIAIVSLICNFYEDPTKVVPTFEVTTKPGFACTYRIEFEACARYKPTGKSNMALMIVTMPSGYVYNQGWGNPHPDISQTEVTNQGSTVTFYFNQFTNTETCVKISTYRAQFVDELKGGTIQVLDYYDTSKQGSNTYPVPDITKPCYYRPFLAIG